MKMRNLKLSLVLTFFFVVCISMNSCSLGVNTTKSVVSTDLITNDNLVSNLYNESPTDDGDEPIEYIYNLEDYRFFVEAAKYPDDFVHYDMIAKLGEFVTFGYYPNSKQNYWYILGNGEQELWLYVGLPDRYDAILETFEKLSYSGDDFTKTLEQGILEIGSAQYVFNPFLMTILWKDDHHSYALYDFDFNKAFDEDSLVIKLFDRRSAEDVLKELQEDISKGIS